MAKPSSFRLYNLMMIAVFLVFAVFIALNQIVLFNAHEWTDLDAVVQEQSAKQALYNGLSQPLALYKYAAYKNRKPEIAIIGTSRAMQIRGSFFTVPIYNLGGLVQGPWQARAIHQRLLKNAPPKGLIFALDYWTFCSTQSVGRRIGIETNHDGLTAVDRDLLVPQLLFQGKLSPTELLRLLHPQTGPLRFGISANLHASGFGPDGSLYSFEAPSADLAQRFASAQSMIATGEGQMVHHCQLSAPALDALDQFVAETEAQGTKVALLLAPLPSTVWKMMRASGQYDYVDQLRAALKSRQKSRFIDDFELGTLGADDCEFGDVIHGGEVAYMRMIRDIPTHLGAPWDHWIDVARLDHMIANNKEHVIVADDGVGTFEKKMRDSVWQADSHCHVPQH